MSESNITTTELPTSVLGVGSEDVGKATISEGTISPEVGNTTKEVQEGESIEDSKLSVAPSPENTPSTTDNKAHHNSSATDSRSRSYGMALHPNPPTTKFVVR